MNSTQCHTLKAMGLLTLFSLSSLLITLIKNYIVHEIARTGKD